ncbi:MAG: hypothetical protein KDD46_01455 [Bdellovibrionales bacterium]|nr:hypothetical protein [Bdellovibrionales bacterium]
MNSFKEKIPQEVVNIAKHLIAENFDVWIVGGAVRNHFLQKTIEDWDLATQATPKQLLSLFPNANVSGIDFGCLMIPAKIGFVQITTLRKEGVYKDYRRPHQVVFCDSIVEDVARRDFTCNAIAYEIRTDTFIDPFEGQKDIQSRMIRSVGDPNVRLNEDALRILRAFRFSAQIGFSLDPLLLAACKSNIGLIPHLSKERIFQEWRKLVVAPFVNNALQSLYAISNLSFLPVALQSVCNVQQVPNVFWLRMAYLLLQANVQTKNLQYKDWVDFGMAKQDAKWMIQLVTNIREYPQGHVEHAYRWIELYGQVTDKKEMLALLNLQHPDIAGQIHAFAHMHPDFNFHHLPVSSNEIIEMTGVLAGPALGSLLHELYCYVAQDPTRVDRETIENWLKNRYTPRK